MDPKRPTESEIQYCERYPIDAAPSLVEKLCYEIRYLQKCNRENRAFWQLDVEKLDTAIAEIAELEDRLDTARKDGYGG